jgi:peptidoglycan/xylan/chitin deacetylase (PgdA/CDA1 family)
MRDFFCWLFWRTGAAALTRALLVSKGRFVLIFHGIVTQRYPDIPHHFVTTVEELRLMLDWLKENFSFLTPSEFLHSTKSGVLLTFDDGLASNYTHALPILEEFNAPALFFVTTQHIITPKNWLPASRQMARIHWAHEGEVPATIAAEYFDGMSCVQLRACATHPLITIGSHTVSHPFLTQCTHDQLKFELTTSKQFLQELTGKSVDLFAYPTGNYDEKVAQAVQAVGYRAAFATDGNQVGLPVFEIPRVALLAANPPYLSAKLSGLHTRPISGLPASAHKPLRKESR